MSDWFTFQGFAYPPYQRSRDRAGTSGTHHDDNDESDDDGGDGYDEEYFDYLCLFVVTFGYVDYFYIQMFYR